MNWLRHDLLAELQPMCRKAQFMPQAIHESTAFNSRSRKVAIHCVFSVKDNTHIRDAFFVNQLHFRRNLPIISIFLEIRAVHSCLTNIYDCIICAAPKIRYIPICSDAQTIDSVLPESVM